ncbi:regulatory iron-sulfur-containing complex subunit RicT [Bacteroidota bacterium]
MNNIDSDQTSNIDYPDQQTAVKEKDSSVAQQQKQEPSTELHTVVKESDSNVAQQREHEPSTELHTVVKESDSSVAQQQEQSSEQHNVVEESDSTVAHQREQSSEQHNVVEESDSSVAQQQEPSSEQYTVVKESDSSVAQQQEPSSEQYTVVKESDSSVAQKQEPSSDQQTVVKENDSSVGKEREPSTEQKSTLTLKPLNETYKKPNYKNKKFPSKIFLNQEFYKRFNVSKAKIDYNVDGEISKLVEITFINKRRQLYYNNNELPFLNYQFVIVEVENGIDIGTVTAFGKCADAKLKLNYKDKVPSLTVIRHAGLDDMEKHKKNLDNHNSVIEKTREYISKYDLDMKITDAEWQFDLQRLTIFFTAPQRIDFRLLVKELARVFKTRIELRQISSREEAKRIGGMGSCGRVLCCASFAHDHCHVTLDHARTQQLSNNVAKLSGYCGRLKCCLLYEFNTYVETFKKYPPMNSEIDFPEGRAKILKADIFREMIHTYIHESSCYKTISFADFTNLFKEGKVFQCNENNGKTKNLQCMQLDPDEDDIEELKKLED